MISFLLTTAAISSLLWALRSLFKRKKNKPGNEQGKPATTGREDREAAPQPVPKEPRQHKVLQEIAEKIQFSTALLVSSVKTGDRLVSVGYPADEIAVRPMSSIADLKRALPGTMVLDDASYYAQVAKNDIPVVEYLERHDIIEERYGEPNNGLVYVQDVSPSMQEYQRMRWALMLIDLVIARAQRGKAKMFFIPFGGVIGTVLSARTPEEFEELKEGVHNMSYISATNISLGLERAMDILEAEEFTSRKILLVTDGTEGINASATAYRLASLGVQLHTVCIGKDHDGLRQISHNYDLFKDSY
jgi:hypothetical protein